MNNKYKFDRNDHGDFYIAKTEPIEDITIADANRVIVEAEDLDSFLVDLCSYINLNFDLPVKLGY